MVQFLSIIFFFLQFLLGFSKVSVYLCHPVCSLPILPSPLCLFMSSLNKRYVKWTSCLLYSLLSLIVVDTYLSATYSSRPANRTPVIAHGTHNIMFSQPLLYSCCQRFSLLFSCACYKPTCYYLSYTYYVEHNIVSFYSCFTCVLHGWPLSQAIRRVNTKIIYRKIHRIYLQMIFDDFDLKEYKFYIPLDDI